MSGRKGTVFAELELAAHELKTDTKPNLAAALVSLKYATDQLIRDAVRLHPDSVSQDVLAYIPEVSRGLDSPRNCPPVDREGTLSGKISSWLTDSFLVPIAKVTDVLVRMRITLHFNSTKVQIKHFLDVLDKPTRQAVQIYLMKQSQEADTTDYGPVYSVEREYKIPRNGDEIVAKKKAFINFINDIIDRDVINKDEKIEKLAKQIKSLEAEYDVAEYVYKRIYDEITRYRETEGLKSSIPASFALLVDLHDVRGHIPETESTDTPRVTYKVDKSIQNVYPEKSTVILPLIKPEILPIVQELTSAHSLVTQLAYQLRRKFGLEVSDYDMQMAPALEEASSTTANDPNLLSGECSLSSLLRDVSMLYKAWIRLLEKVGFRGGSNTADMSLVHPEGYSHLMVYAVVRTFYNAWTTEKKIVAEKFLREHSTIPQTQDLDAVEQSMITFARTMKQYSGSTSFTFPGMEWLTEYLKVKLPFLRKKKDEVRVLKRKRDILITEVSRMALAYRLVREQIDEVLANKDATQGNLAFYRLSLNNPEWLRQLVTISKAGYEENYRTKLIVKDEMHMVNPKLVPHRTDDEYDYGVASYKVKYEWENKKQP